MFHYVSNAGAVNESYLRAKSILTPLDNDHVRFSWLVSVGVLLAGWQYVEKRKENQTISLFLAIVAVWLIIFLHILGARTGLFSFYFMTAGMAAWLIFKKLRWVQGLVLLVVLTALP